MPRALGDLTLDEYAEFVRTGKGATPGATTGPTPDTPRAPRPASPRRGRRQLAVVAMAGCIVLAFTAGTFKEKRFKGPAQIGEAQLLDPALWPQDLVTQQRTTVAAQKQGLWLVNHLLDVALRRPVEGDSVRANALVSTVNIARQCIENLQAAEAAGHPLARECLELVSAALNNPK